MAKQRFVVYKALDKGGRVLLYLLVVGGKNMPFAGSISCSTHLSSTSDEIIGRFGCSSFSTKGWMDYARRKGASLIQKVIYFN